MSWFILTWFPEHGNDKVHPDDREFFGAGVQGHVVPLVSQEEAWQIISLAGCNVRVNPTLLRQCNEPDFKVGDAVETIPPRTKRLGKIFAVTWHFKNKQHLYHINCNGKKITTHYVSSELQARA